jgi:hypothetical protein
LPKGLNSVLEIGAWDGHYSRLLTKYFKTVTAIDLEYPQFQIDRVITAKGNVTCLDFPDNSFDCVFCTEVLEHIPEIEKACHEISRVAKGYVIVGVPYKQDIRVGRTTCLSCGKINPPWRHMNTFDEIGLKTLFAALNPVLLSYVGTNKSRTNCLSTWLMDLAGNPWGTYNQEEPCIKCGAKLVVPINRSINRNICSAVAHRINRIQSIFVEPWPNWIHVVFQKE